jgi:hypothetical protein
VLPEGAAIPDEEESAFEIPRAEAAEQMAEEFEFEVHESDQSSGDQLIRDQGSVDQGSGIGLQVAEKAIATEKAQRPEAASDGSTDGEDQQIPEPDTTASAEPDRPDA